MTDRKELKAAARLAIRETRPSAIWVTLMTVVILLVTQVLSLSLNGDLEAYKEMYESVLAGQPEMIQPAGASSGFGWLLALALDLMSMVVSVGYALYALRLSRRGSPSFGDVFDAFGMFFRAVFISVLRGAVISLWSFAYVLPASMLASVTDPLVASLVCLPLLIPMFMAAYSYRLAVFIQIDEPDRSSIQCLSLSRLAMQGRRWELFKLDLSFLGWMLLSLIPFVALWVEPYMTVTNAGYYDAVMPAFREKFSEQLRNARQSGGGYPPKSDYHIPGESRHDGGGDGSVDDDDPEDM